MLPQQKLQIDCVILRALPTSSVLDELCVFLLIMYMMRANKLKTALSRNCLYSLSGPGFFMYTYMYVLFDYRYFLEMKSILKCYTNAHRLKKRMCY